MDYRMQEINLKFPTCEKQKNRENTRKKKTITHTRQYLRGLTICLHPQSVLKLCIKIDKITF